MCYRCCVVVLGVTKFTFFIFSLSLRLLQSKKKRCHKNYTHFYAFGSIQLAFMRDFVSFRSLSHRSWLWLFKFVTFFESLICVYINIRPCAMLRKELHCLGRRKAAHSWHEQWEIERHFHRIYWWFVSEWVNGFSLTYRRVRSHHADIYRFFFHAALVGVFLPCRHTSHVSCGWTDLKNLSSSSRSFFSLV